AEKLLAVKRGNLAALSGLTAGGRPSRGACPIRREEGAVMHDGKALLAAVCEQPEDDLARLAYADWLDETGESARAEFIRGQIAMLRLEPDDPRLAPLAARTAELEQQHGKRWKRTLPRWASLKYEFIVADMMQRPDHLPDSLFHRGFPAVIECTCAEWRRNAARLLQRLPIQGVCFSDAADAVDDLLQAPLLERLSAVHLGESGPAGEGLERFVNLPSLSNLRVLLAYLNELGEDSFRAIGEAESLACLEVLDLWGNDCGAAGAEALAASTVLRNLHALKLSHNQMGDAGLRALAGSAILDSVRDLDLGGNGLTATGVRVLAKSRHLGSLTHLYLGFNAIATAG